MKACLQASIVGERNNLSFGGAARCKINRMGIDIDDDDDALGERTDALMV